MSKHDCQTIRELSYRACIPYFILFDQDLNEQHLKLYGIIEQMESNPNPKVRPTFSYTWFANLLGIQPRAAKRIAKTMKEKNYLVHRQLGDGTWLWGTAKKMVIDDSPNEGVSPEGGVSQNDTPPVSPQDTPPVSQNDTQNTNKENYQKEENTKLASSSFSFSESTDKNLVAQKLERDKRSNEEFLAECVIHVDNHSDQKYPRLQRANALVKLLSKLKSDNVIFRPKTDLKEDKSSKPKAQPLFTEEEGQLMQEYLHAKKMEDWGQDINIYMPNAEKRERAKELLARSKAMESKGCTNSPNSNARKCSLMSVSNLVSHLA
jgi:hypothetical protein